MRRSIRIAATIVAIAVGVSLAMSFIAPPTTDRVDPDESDEPELVRMEGSESAFWPYLSSAEEHRKGSSVNVVARADADTVFQRLREDTDADWNETDEDLAAADEERYSIEEVGEDDAVVGTTVEWGEAPGSTRYAYVDDGGVGNGAGWTDETYQVHRGDYYGHRYHIRMYDAPHSDDEWTIMQAHTEHFDWFTLRHAVHGNEEAQQYVESDFRDQPFVEELWRKDVGNDEPYDNDGWVTVVEFAVVLPALLVGTIGSGSAIRERGRALWRHLDAADRRRLRAVGRRVTVDHLVLFGALVGTVLGVRIAGILLERHAGFLSVHAIAALLYPFLALGLPVVAYGLGRRLPRRMDAGAVAALGLSAAVVIDFTALSVDVIPVEILVHRTGLVLALGLIGAGAAERATRESPDNGWIVVGGALWAVLLAIALFGFL